MTSSLFPRQKQTISKSSENESDMVYQGLTSQMPETVNFS